MYDLYRSLQLSESILEKNLRWNIPTSFLCLGGRSHEAYSSSFVCQFVSQSVSHYAEGGANEVYCNRAVCHYAEGGANEVYCNRAVCQSVIMPRAELTRYTVIVLSVIMPRWAEPRGIL